MPSFVYEAADTIGRVLNGTLEGDCEADVIRALEQQNLVPLRMRRARSREHTVASAGQTSKLRLTLRELLEFSRQLRVMLASGVTLLAILGLLRQRAHGTYQRLLDAIAGDIQRGSTLSEALAGHPRTFDPFYVGTMRAGEAAGVHTEALGELIAYYERRADLRRDVVSALFYPAIVVCVLILACIVLLTFVVPQFETIFATNGLALPLPTRLLLATSAFIRGHAWELLAGLGGTALVAWRLSPVPRVRALAGRVLSRLPLMGHVAYLASVIQFCRMTSLLEHAGLPILETLKIVGEMLMPGPVRELVIAIRREVMTGNSLTSALEGTNVLPDLVGQMILVGEQTGRIDETLAAAAVHYEEELRVRIKRLTIMLEPLLTIVISALVLGVALAIFLPMWGMNSALLNH